MAKVLVVEDDSDSLDVIRRTLEKGGHHVLAASNGWEGLLALDAHHADVLASHLPDLDRQTETVEEFALFANPDDRYTRLAHWVFLALFCAIASAEWVIRKAAGLV